MMRLDRSTTLEEEPQIRLSVQMLATTEYVVELYFCARNEYYPLGCDPNE